MRQTITEDKLFDEERSLATIEIEGVPTLSQLFKNAINSARDNEKERIKVLSWLYHFQKLTPFVIGDILLDWENILKQNYDNALNYQRKSGKSGQLPAKNTFEWFNNNPGKLPFGYKEARQYIAYRLDREDDLIEDPEKLKKDIPLKHNNILRKIKDEDVRQKLKDKAVEEGLSARKLEEEVSRVNLKFDKQEEYDQKKNKIKINVTLEKNNIVVHFQNQHHRDIGNTYIQRQIDAIKQRIIDQT